MWAISLGTSPTVPWRQTQYSVLGQSKEADVAVLEAARDLEHRMPGLRRCRQEPSQSTGVADQGHVRVDDEAPLQT